MGCVVNGPGEAREADLGIAAGRGKGHLFVRGQGRAGRARGRDGRRARRRSRARSWPRASRRGSPPPTRTPKRSRRRRARSSSQIQGTRRQPQRREDRQDPRDRRLTLRGRVDAGFGLSLGLECGEHGRVERKGADRLLDDPTAGVVVRLAPAASQARESCSCVENSKSTPWLRGGRHRERVRGVARLERHPTVRRSTARPGPGRARRRRSSGCPRRNGRGAAPRCRRRPRTRSSVVHVRDAQADHAVRCGERYRKMGQWKR